MLLAVEYRAADGGLLPPLDERKRNFEIRVLEASTIGTATLLNFAAECRCGNEGSWKGSGHG
jgi:hypothetical protein